MDLVTTAEFLSRMRSLDVRFSIEGGRLRYSAPPGVVTSDLREEILLRKSEILQFFNEAALAKKDRPIKPTSREVDLPLSFAQQRLWLLNQLEPGSSAYNIPFFFDLKGDLHVDVLEQSLTEILCRHEVLRTHYAQSNDGPIQRISPAEPLRIPLLDLTSLPETAQREEATRLAFTDATKPFDLEKVEPMLRANLLRFARNHYVLLLNVHHIAFDGWSLGVLVTELNSIYAAFLQRKKSPLPELPVQYADYTVWQHDSIRENDFEAQWQYWRQVLRGPLPILELPADYPRPAIQSHKGGDVSFNFSKELSCALHAVSKREELTIFVVLLTAFKILLLRYSGQDDILVGTPVAHRNRTEIEHLIGFFLNTVVVRSDLSGNPTFRTLLRRVQEGVLGAYAHQEMPFEKLVEQLHPHRDVSRTPVFQTMFSLLPIAEALRLPDLEPSHLEFHNSSAQFDLSLTMMDSADRISGSFSFNADLFEKDTISRMAGHFEMILQGMASDLEQKICDLPLLSEPEREQILVEWNRTDADYPSDSCIHELFEKQAAETPTAIAVEFEGEKITYSGLNERANHLAHKLATLGAGQNELIAVCLERSAEMSIALLGILKTGAAYLPIDITLPRERGSFMLQDAKPRILITHSSLMERVPNHGIQVVCIDRIEEKSDPTRSLPRSRPGDIAYVLYTSGSTGQPKGVQISHRSVVNFLSSMRIAPGICSQDTLLSVTTFSFDIFGLELWLPLTTGAKVVIASTEVVMDGSRLAKLIAHSKATVMQATPATWRLLLEGGWKGDPRLKILCGGESWASQLASRLLPKCSSLWNMYGPTETTIWSAVRRVDGDEKVLVGHPIANTQFYVVDSYLQPVPVGVPGELLIGGDGIACGYLNRPKLTAEKFIPDPFTPNSDRTLYRTGDRVRYRPDGTIEFLARLDHQIKIRGYRIELGEIENALRTSSFVKEAVVLSRDDGQDKYLVAYIQGNDGSGDISEELRRQLKQSLPDYMIPSAFVFLREFPLTPSGKIDRKALPAPQARKRTSESSTAPSDLLEFQLARLWEKVLRVHPVGLTDDFFDLGGHSFAAVRLLAEIRKLTGKTLPLATLFQASTVKAIAEILRRDGWTPTWSSLVPIQPNGSKPPLYLVHGAEGNVLLYRHLVQHLGADQPVYGLQSQGLSGEGDLHESVQAMASAYVKEILATQSVGPYILGGYCLGGVVALEMAQQLKAKGYKVKLVLMLDTYNAHVTSPLKMVWLAVPHLLQNVWFHTANALSVPNGEHWKFVQEKINIQKIRFGIRMHAIWSALRRAGFRDLSNPYPHLRLKRINDRAAAEYAPSTYQGRVAVIRSKGNFWGLASTTLGWDSVIEGLEVHEMSAYPKGMLIAPFAQRLAEIVTRCLRGSAMTTSEVPASMTSLRVRV
jgi:aspartate racemase